MSAPAKAELTVIKTVTNTAIPQTLTNGTTSTSTAGVNQGVTANVLETTTTSVSNLAGAATASQTTASVTNPTQAVSSLTQPSQLIQTTGNATGNVNSTSQGTQANAQANLNVGISNVVTVSTCLGASASVGSSHIGSVDNCSNSVKTKKVPEPGTLLGLTFMGAYLIFRRRKVSLSKKLLLYIPIQSS